MNILLAKVNHKSRKQNNSWQTRLLIRVTFSPQFWWDINHKKCYILLVNYPTSDSTLLTVEILPLSDWFNSPGTSKSIKHRRVISRISVRK